MSDRIMLHENSFRFKYATMEQIQFVWAEVSRGQTTIREIARKRNYHQEFVLNVLHFLKKCGYVEHDPCKTGWKVIIPFVTVEVDREEKDSKPVPVHRRPLRAAGRVAKSSMVKA